MNVGQKTITHVQKARWRRKPWKQSTPLLTDDDIRIASAAGPFWKLRSETAMKSDSVIHDAAYAVATFLTNLQKENNGTLVFGQIYCAVKHGLEAYEENMARLRLRILPVESEN